MKRAVLTWLISLLFLPMMACAEGGAPEFIEGQHYQRLNQAVRTRDPAKIEVVEVFWYGCPHCFHFEPLIKSWLQNKPEDVDFWRSPAMWNDLMRTHARAFYVADALGALDNLHEPLFEAINLQRRELATEQELERLFVDHGVSAEEFRKAYNSFGVTSQVRQADARARSYQIRGTPELVVDGRYRITARMAGGQEEMLDVVDFLVQRIRASQTAEQQ